MEKLMIAGRGLFSLSIIGMALQQLFYPQFRSLFVPETPGWLPLPEVWVYLFSCYLIISSIIILTGKSRMISLITGGVFVALFLFFHVPYRFTQTPNNLGMWAIAIKCLAFAGGAFITTGLIRPAAGKNMSSRNVMVERLIPFGIILFALMLIAFGTDHFLYTTGVSRMVPHWIPGSVFWTYFSGIALIGSGIAILLKIRPNIIAMLAGTMILIWAFILHLPGALAMPDTGNSHALTSTFHALGFSGIAFMISGLSSLSPEKLNYRQISAAWTKAV